MVNHCEVMIYYPAAPHIVPDHTCSPRSEQGGRSAANLTPPWRTIQTMQNCVAKVGNRKEKS